MTVRGQGAANGFRDRWLVLNDEDAQRLDLLAGARRGGYRSVRRNDTLSATNLNLT